MRKIVLNEWNSAQLETKNWCSAFKLWYDECLRILKCHHTNRIIVGYYNQPWSYVVYGWVI